MSSTLLLLNSDFVNWTQTEEAATHASWALQLDFEFDFDFGGTFTRFLPALVRYFVFPSLQPGLIYVACCTVKNPGERGNMRCLGYRKWSHSVQVQVQVPVRVRVRVRAEICNSCIKLSLFYFSLFLFIFYLLLSNLVTWSLCVLGPWSYVLLFAPLLRFQSTTKWVKWRPLLFSVITEPIWGHFCLVFLSIWFSAHRSDLIGILPAIRNQFPSKLFELDR